MRGFLDEIARKANCKTFLRNFALACKEPAILSQLLQSVLARVLAEFLLFRQAANAQRLLISFAIASSVSVRIHSSLFAVTQVEMSLFAFAVTQVCSQSLKWKGNVSFVSMLIESVRDVTLEIAHCDFTH